MLQGESEYKSFMFKHFDFKGQLGRAPNKISEIILRMTQLDFVQQLYLESMEKAAFTSDTKELVFRSEIACMAFLGAAKSYYSRKEVEFNV
jgi:hypothetical protein